MIEYILPNRLSNALKGKETTIDNYALKLNKVPAFDEKEEKYSFLKVENKRIQFFNKPVFNEQHIVNYSNRLHRILESLKDDKQIYDFIKLDLPVAGNLAVGISGGIYDTSIKLHPIGGFPFVPGSEFKGMFRSAILSECFKEKALQLNNSKPETDQKQEYQLGEEIVKIAESNKLFAALFGKMEQQGGLQFFDVLPLEAPDVRPNIVNPHNRAYYGQILDLDQNGVPLGITNKAYPDGMTNPLPVILLTVHKTKFRFLVGLNNNLNKKLNEFENWENLIITDNPQIAILKGDNNFIDFINAWLPYCLAVHGIGAKTSRGFGQFSVGNRLTSDGEESKEINDLPQFILEQFGSNMNYKRNENGFGYIGKIQQGVKLHAKFLRNVPGSPNKIFTVFIGETLIEKQARYPADIPLNAHCIVSVLPGGKASSFEINPPTLK